MNFHLAGHITEHQTQPATIDKRPTIAQLTSVGAGDSLQQLGGSHDEGDTWEVHELIPRVRSEHRHPALHLSLTGSRQQQRQQQRPQHQPESRPHLQRAAVSEGLQLS